MENWQKMKYFTVFFTALLYVSELVFIIAAEKHLFCASYEQFEHFFGAVRGGFALACVVALCLQLSYIYIVNRENKKRDKDDQIDIFNIF